MRAKRIIYNKSSNDFNDEPEYKLQNVKIKGESKNSYIVNTGSYDFKVHKSNIFFNKQDFINKCNDIRGFNLTDYEKQQLSLMF